VTPRDGLACWDPASGKAAELPGLDQLTGVVAAAIGDEHVCVMRSDGTVDCIGDNDGGQLGRPGDARGGPVRVPRVQGAVAISAGGDLTCVVTTDRALWCWGDPGFDRIEAHEPINVDDIGDATGVRVGVGARSVCVDRSGPLECVGESSFREYDGEPGWRRAPAGVTLASLDASSHACAVAPDGVVSCRGKIAWAPPGSRWA
jgi:hypothetical protein